MTKLPLEQALRLATAHHESSHALAARVLGMEVHYMEMGGEGTNYAGITFIIPTHIWSEPDAEGGMYSLGLEACNAVNGYAGEFGHTRFFREYSGNPKAKPSNTHFQSDRKKARQVTTDKVLVRQYRSAAKAIVDINWPTIRMMAHELEKRDVMERERIEHYCTKAILPDEYAHLYSAFHAEMNKRLKQLTEQRHV